MGAVPSSANEGKYMSHGFLQTISLNVFSITIQIIWEFRFALISVLTQWLYEIVRMARQLLCCRGMYEKL